MIGYNVVDQADPSRFRSINHFPGKDELQRPARSHKPCEPLRATIPWNHTQADFRQAQLCALYGYPDMTSHGEFASSAQRKPVDGREHRLGTILYPSKQTLAIF